MIIHSPIISGSLTFADGAALSLPNPTQVSGSFSGSVQISQIKSDLIPDTSGAYDLGSEAYPFQDLWLVGNTLNIGGIGIGAGIGGINIKNKSDNSPAEIGAKSITIGGSIGSSGSKKFKLNSNNKVTLLDENDDEDVLEVKELVLKDTTGNGKNTKLKVTGGKFTTSQVNNSGTDTADDAEGALSGSFTGSIQDAEFNGDATFNNGMSVTGTSALGVTNVSGLASLDGGVDVDGAFTVADSTGNVATSGTLGVTGTSTLGVINASGLLSADAGIDVDGAFTVADSTGNVSTTGTLGAGNTTIAGTVDASGLASLDGGIDVDGAFTVADSTGNVSTTGTLGAGNTTIAGTVDASGLASLDGGVDVDGAFTVADTSGNVATSGTLNVTGLTTVGVISGSAMDITGDLGVGGDLTVAGAMTTDGHIIPSLHNTYDLGSTTKFWRDLYLSSGSLYINGIQVLSTDGTDLTFQTDEGESTKILETANDTITLESVNGDITLVATGTGNIELDAPVQIAAGKNILSSDGNAISFASDISLGSNDIFASNLVGVVSSSAITYDGNDITVLGNLTVQGTQTQLNTATLNIEDKNLLIASGAADSAAANGGGITIDGADASITWVSADSNIAFNTAVNIPTSGLKINSTAVTSTATELNVLDGIPATLTATELGYVDGVTSGIQAQIDELHTSSSASNVSGSASYLPLYDSNGTAFENSIVSQSSYGEGDLQIEINGRAVINQQVISTTYSSPSGIALRLGGSGNSEEIRIEGADIESASDSTKKILVVGSNGQIHTADGDENVTFNDITGSGLLSVTGVGTSEFASHLKSHCLGVGMNPTGTAGEIHASADIVAYSSSDKRLKENIKPIENPLGKIAQISGNTFDWVENSEVHSHKGTDIGVIAQEIEAVLPELVTTRENGYKAVKYDKVVALLIEAVKDQQAQIDELKSKLS
jgi:hypothetical protein